ncbi:hypothetical protein Nepgr_026779 [Nepenthes gracilis]|uniref:Expansin-like EG45 domain-containing protein n=1 Tax=Nepenthes gracilis TaxID=150966 RepID=A0AAD3TAD4_NEPGR|nr:hypothetical protein Nepgr_026779 [Nepenthes gracilis]
MGGEMRLLAVVAMMLCLSGGAHAAVGIGVFYGPPYTPSACYRGANEGVMVAGVSAELWNNGAACGRYYTVTCIGGTNEAPHPCKPNTSVTVKVVDYCQLGCQGQINLSRDAFARIANPDAGIVRIQYFQAG